MKKKKERWTEKRIEALFDSFRDGVHLDCIFEDKQAKIKGFDIAWSLKGKGFGHIEIFSIKSKLKIKTEMEGKEFAKVVLCSLIEKAELID